MTKTYMAIKYTKEVAKVNNIIEQTKGMDAEQWILSADVSEQETIIKLLETIYTDEIGWVWDAFLTHWDMI